jgi:hypothetical protein
MRPTSVVFLLVGSSVRQAQIYDKQQYNLSDPSIKKPSTWSEGFCVSACTKENYSKPV